MSSIIYNGHEIQDLIINGNQAQLWLNGQKLYPSAEPAPVGRRVDLSSLTGDYTAQDGDILYGTLAGNYKISIADGATVTLDGATINGANEESCVWAGISCVGDCNIVLAANSTNSLKGFYDEYPGIYVPSNYTLTISGTGSLDARSNGYASGIGGGYGIAAGNISISGGTITATGGQYSAGIGGSNATVGNISISGGSVTAMGGKYAAGIGGGNNGTVGDISISGGSVTADGGTMSAGIGSGYNGTAGNITITTNVTRVTSSKGAGATYSVGPGYNGTITGDVTIGGTVTGPIADSPWVYDPSDPNSGDISSIIED